MIQQFRLISTGRSAARPLEQSFTIAPKGDGAGSGGCAPSGPFIAAAYNDPFSERDVRILAIYGLGEADTVAWTYVDHNAPCIVLLNALDDEVLALTVSTDCESPFNVTVTASVNGAVIGAIDVTA